MHYTIEQDLDPCNPCKDWDMYGTLALQEDCRYDFGHERLSLEELSEIASSDEYVSLPVYMLDHSGITISTESFGCPWDSGQVGIVYMRKDNPEMCDKWAQYLQGTVETVNQYLQGDVWGYTVSDSEGETLDSCWGFYGHEECVLEAKQVLAYWEKEARKRKQARLKAQIKHRAPLECRG